MQVGRIELPFAEL